MDIHKLIQSQHAVEMFLKLDPPASNPDPGEKVIKVEKAGFRCYFRLVYLPYRACFVQRLTYRRQGRDPLRRASGRK